MKLNLPEILCAVALTVGAAPLSSMEVDDLFSGKYRAKSVAGIRPSADGVHYTCLSPDRTCIVRYAYATGEVVDTLLDVARVPGKPVQSISGYSFGEDEDRMPIYTDVEVIYRRSFRAAYYFTRVGNMRCNAGRGSVPSSRLPRGDRGRHGWPLFTKTIFT